MEGASCMDQIEGRILHFPDLSKIPRLPRGEHFGAETDLGELNIEMNSAMNATRRAMIARSAKAVAARPSTRVAALSTIAPSRNNNVSQARKKRGK